MPYRKTLHRSLLQLRADRARKPKSSSNGDVRVDGIQCIGQVILLTPNTLATFCFVIATT